MDQILYINSASIEDLSISASLVSAPGSSIDFSQSTQVSGSFVGNLVGSASYASTASHVATVGAASTATSASYALSSSHAISASHALVANTANSSATASYVVGQKNKAGIAQGAWFSGNPKKYTVNFTSSFADTNYSIQVIGQVSRTWLVESQTTSSFVINSNGNQAFTGPVYWHAVVSGEYNS